LQKKNPQSKSVIYQAAHHMFSRKTNSEFHESFCENMWWTAYLKKTKFFSPKIMQMQPGDYTQVIYDRGCLRSGEEWVERNLVPVAAVAVALAVLQASNKLQLFFFAHHSFFL
jgi:hypothetical protein